MQVGSRRVRHFSRKAGLHSAGVVTVGILAWRAFWTGNSLEVAVVEIDGGETRLELFRDNGGGRSDSKRKQRLRR